MFTFVAEVVSASARGLPADGNDERNFCESLAVLIPAHDESSCLLDTLSNVKAQLRPQDRLLVVADNCSDDTAAIARNAGAEVVVREDPARIGKGFALDFGLRRLSADPPEVVVVIDADCLLQTNALQRLASSCAAARRPAQALYLMTAPDQPSLDYRAATFAFRVRNLVRPLGLSALGLPCHLTGTGMALPWEAIRTVDLASGSLVEDIKLSLDLAAAGHPALFCPAAKVTSRFPSSMSGAKSQRQRWEQGHLDVIAKTIPRLIGVAIARRSFSLAVLALDVAVPPLALLVSSVAVTWFVSAVALLLGASATALIVNSVSAIAFSLGVLLCWSRFGRDVLPIRALPSVARHVLDKLSIYRRIFSRERATRWVRADRGK